MIYLQFSARYYENTENMLIGGLGEEAFFQMCQDLGLGVTKELKHFEWDFNVCGKHVDVKVLKNNFGPKEGFLLNVRANQINPHIDMFAFFVFNLQTSELTFVGAIPKDEFLQRSTLKRAGEIEKTGFEYHCDTYTIAVSQLQSLENALRNSGKMTSHDVKNDVIFGENDIKMTSDDVTLAGEIWV